MGLYFILGGMSRKRSERYGGDFSGSSGCEAVLRADRVPGRGLGQR